MEFRTAMRTKLRSIFRQNRFWAGLLLAQFVLFFCLSKIPAVVKFFQEFFEYQKLLHQKLFRDLPFSAGDALYVFLSLALVYLLLKTLRRHTRNAALRTLLVMLNTLYFFYQIFWGMLYFQTPVSAQFPTRKVERQDAEQLAIVYLKRCRETRKLVQEDRNGVFKVYNRAELERSILKEQKSLPGTINQKQETGVNNIKPSLFSPVMSYTGILGYYNPFTAEAQYNPLLPSSQLPFTLAHESAHQLGYAREHEANFVGYLIGKNAVNADLRYSTEYYTLKALLGSIVQENPEFVKAVIRNYSAGMKRDRLAEKMFVRRHEGVLDVFFGFTNDLFLKSNQQEGSITYSYFVDLLLQYEMAEK